MKLNKKAALLLSAFLVAAPVAFANGKLNKEIAQLEMELVKMETKAGEYKDCSEIKLAREKDKTRIKLDKKKKQAKKEAEKAAKKAKKGLKKAGEEIKEAGKTVGEAFGDFFN